MKSPSTVDAPPPRRSKSIRPARATGTILIAAGAALYFIDSDVARLFLPLRYVVIICLLLGAALLILSTGIRSLRGWAAAWIVVAILSIGLASVVYVREFSRYRELSLGFENYGTRLEGTLYLPITDGPHPAVVIAHGSIRAPRRFYHLWADNLVRRGIAVYSFDKRGTGSSGGMYEEQNNSSTENLTLLASDVAAAAVTLRQQPEIDDESIGVLGISMGGWTAPLAAQQTDAVRFLVAISGPSVSVGEENYYSELTGEGHEEGSGLSQVTIDSLLFDRAPEGFDPRPVLKALTIPGLWLFGEVDSSVPTRKCVAVLDSLILDEGKPYAYRVLPGAEHLGLVMNWPFDLAPGYWEEITGWIHQVAAASPPRQTEGS